jgi:hypothetical protein
MPDGKKYSIPKLEYIKPALGLKFAELEVTTDPKTGKQTADMHETSKLVKLIFETYFPGKDLFELFDETEQFGEWMEAWTEASGVTLGKSEASPKS